MPEVWEGKSYKMTDSENFDDYMKELGKRNRFFILFVCSFIHFLPNRTILNG